MAAAERDYPTRNPNFPLDLDIHPSENPLASDLDADFGLHAQELAIREYGIAGRVWESAYAMAMYMRSPPTLEFDPPIFDWSKPSSFNLIELGSGSGLVASVVAQLSKPGRDRLIATDLPEVCALLENNLRKQTGFFGPNKLGQSSVAVKPLFWGNVVEADALATAFFNPDSPSYLGSLTHIICSDLVYFPELLAPLLRSLLHITTPPFVPFPSKASASQPSIFISYKVRSLAKETMFWTAFGLWFDFRPVLVRERTECADGEWRRFGSNLDDIIFIFVAHRRHDSYKWKVPALDEELLGGVGALGTDDRKGDDTFENLLLMSLVPE